MKHSRRTVRKGATLVEFAFIVPVMLLILLGILEFGWYARNQLAVANATREGARAASIGRTKSEIETRVVNTAKPAVVSTGDITLSYSSTNGTSYSSPLPADKAATSTQPAQNGVQPGQLVRVTVSTPHRRMVGLPVTPARINVSVTMVRERS